MLLTIEFFCSNIVDVTSYDELKEAISQGKWARGPWVGRYVVMFYTKIHMTYDPDIRESLALFNDVL